MPKITPYSESVNWNNNELVIGVVGVAPWATLEFCKALYSYISANKDWHYPRVIIDANAKIPSRGRYFELHERDPSPYIKATILELFNSGAGVVVVPCNTAHILFDRWASESPVIIPNIIDACCDRLSHLGGRVVAVFESLNLRKSKLYESRVTQRGFTYYAITDQQAKMIASFIENIKRNAVPNEECLADFYTLVNHLEQSGVDSIIIGCTELTPFINSSVRNKMKFIDSNSELARAAVIAANCRLK